MAEDRQENTISSVEADAASRGQTVNEYLSEAETQKRWEDPETHRQRFEELSGLFKKGEFTRRNEDGSRTTITSYERHIDPSDNGDITLLGEFRLRAAAVGMREAFSPLTLQTQSVLEGKPHRPLTFVQFGYEKLAVEVKNKPITEETFNLGPTPAESYTRPSTFGLQGK